MYQSVILAAGLGTRMLPLTEHTPKPLLPSVENSLLLNQINFLKNYEMEVTVTIGYQKEKMKEALRGYGVNEFIHSENKGNAYWLNQIDIAKFKGPVVVITSDNLMEIDINNLIEEYFRKGEKSMIISVNLENAKGDKIKVGDSNNIKAMDYQTSSGVIASGLQILNLEDIKKNNLQFDDFHEVWGVLINEERLILSDYQPTKWTSVDTVDDLKKFKNYF